MFMSTPKAKCRMLADRRGAALVEMAIALPILLLFLFGVLSFGSWLALAHGVQQSANEAARAAIAGLSPGEREQIARQVAQTTLAGSYRIDPATLAVTVQDDGATLTVDVSYDGSANPLLSLPLVPPPSRIIARKSAIRLTGL